MVLQAVSEGHFPKPIKLGRSSRWYKVKWSSGCSSELRNHEEQHETVVMPVRCQCAKCRRWYCGNRPVPGAGDTPAHLSADTLWSPTVCHHFLTDSSFPSSRQSLCLYRTVLVLMCAFRVSAPAYKIHRGKIVQITEALLSAPGKSGVLFSRGWTTGHICWHFTHAPFGRRKHQRATYSCILYSFYERITERNHTTSPSSPVVYAGCGNNMEEQQCDACCCSADEYLSPASQCHS